MDRNIENTALHLLMGQILVAVSQFAPFDSTVLQIAALAAIDNPGELREIYPEKAEVFVDYVLDLGSDDFKPGVELLQR